MKETLSGTWRLTEFRGNFQSKDCVISFMDQQIVVFEEEFEGGVFGRFWFEYELDLVGGVMILRPLNRALSKIYRGRVRKLHFLMQGQRLRIIHSESSFSEYTLDNYSYTPADGDLFPKWKPGEEPSSESV